MSRANERPADRLGYDAGQAAARTAASRGEDPGWVYGTDRRAAEASARPGYVRAFERKSLTYGGD